MERQGGRRGKEERHRGREGGWRLLGDGAHILNFNKRRGKEGELERVRVRERREGATEVKREIGRNWIHVEHIYLYRYIFSQCACQCARVWRRWRWWWGTPARRIPQKARMWKRMEGRRKRGGKGWWNSVSTFLFDPVQICSAHFCSKHAHRPSAAAADAAALD